MSAPAPICYLRGTRLRTTKTGRCVEDLKIGERVVILSGDNKPSKPVSKPIKWIGRQRFEKRSERWPANLEPVRIRRFALDEQTPHRNLYLSPNHAIYIDGLLIPAKYLINGTSIVQAMPEGVEEIEYFHIELETHEVIFAEGVAAETLLVMKDREAFADLIREQFDNFAERKQLYGNDAVAMTPCAPRVCYNGRRSELKALLRRAASPVVDVRDPIQFIHDRLAVRGAELEHQPAG
jgi:Hint domain